MFSHDLALSSMDTDSPESWALWAQVRRQWGMPKSQWGMWMRQCPSNSHAWCLLLKCFLKIILYTSQNPFIWGFQSTLQTSNRPYQPTLQLVTTQEEKRQALGRQWPGWKYVHNTGQPCRGLLVGKHLSSFPLLPLGVLKPNKPFFFWQSWILYEPG